MIASMPREVPRTLSNTEVVRARQRSLLLGDDGEGRTAGSIVTWLGAMQSQDFASGAWSLGVRLPGSRLADVEAAIESGEVLRTWPMRGTIHLVPPEDTRWMLALTATRALGASLKRREELGLDLRAVDRGVALLEEALRGGRRLTRAEALAALSDGGIRSDGQAGYHLLGYAAHVGAICFGPNVAKQQTFVRLADWAPRQRTLSAEESLTELGWRYVRGHGPVTDADFARWSGLTLTAARRAVDANRDRLASAVFRGETVWMSRDLAAGLAAGLPAQPTHALPGFDEYMLGYSDRVVHVPEEHLAAIVPGNNGLFRATICVDGRVVATWTRSLRKDHVLVDLRPFAPLTARVRAATDRALARYGEFVGLPVRCT